MSPTTQRTTPDFDKRLDNLAKLGIRIGVNLQPGQELIITAPLEASDLVRRLTEQAYHDGASLVTTIYDDPATLLARLEHAEEESLDQASDWLPDAIVQALEAGAARLQILGPYPDLLRDIPIERSIRLHRAMAKASTRETAYLAKGQTNSAKLLYPTRSWATSVYPEHDPDTALEMLWNVIFTATLSDQVDPVKALSEKLQSLDSRQKSLQSKNLAELHFYDSETDLTIGLLNGRCWSGGICTADNGVTHAPNLMVQELCTATLIDTAEGHLRLTKPLALPGGRVEGAHLEIRHGRIVSLIAEQGRESLEALLTVDPGAGLIGQTGLAAPTAPFRHNDTGFNNPLLDRNSGCHVGFGRPDLQCLCKDVDLGGINKSTVHIDWFFASDGINVDGLDRDGKVTPIMRSGDFLSDRA